MTLTIDRAALMALIAQKFELSEFDTVALESLADKAFNKIDNNRLID